MENQRIAKWSGKRKWKVRKTTIGFSRPASSRANTLNNEMEF